MKAIGIPYWGGPEVLEVVQLEDPQPGPDEVRIRVRAATVNPTDTLLRAGAQAARYADKTPPIIPGMDLAGVVDEVGAGVDRLSVGDQVTALMVPASRYGGAYAELVVAPAASVVGYPDGADDAHASTLLMNALTARLAIDALDLAPGEAIAVTGSAGALGGYLVALGAADGLRVIADAKPEDEDLIRSFGASLVLPRGADFAAAVRQAEPDGVPGLVDCSLQGLEVVPAIRPGGGLAVVRGWSEAEPDGLTVHRIMVGEHATETEKLERLREQASDATLALRVAEVFPAARAADAHRRLEAGGVRGRLVLDFSQPLG